MRKRTRGGGRGSLHHCAAGVLIRMIRHRFLAIRLLDFRVGRVLVNPKNLVQSRGINIRLPARRAAAAAEGIIATTTKIEKHLLRLATSPPRSPASFKPPIPHRRRHNPRLTRARARKQTHLSAALAPPPPSGVTDAHVGEVTCQLHVAKVTCHVIYVRGGSHVWAWLGGGLVVWKGVAVLFGGGHIVCFLGSVECSLSTLSRCVCEEWMDKS